jgi:hypothetical protein
MYREHQIARRARRRTRWHFGLVLALVSLLALTACGSQGAGSGPTSTSRPSMVSPKLTAEFALLRGPAEGLPASIKRRYRSPMPGIDLSLAQRVPVSVPGKYWLTPGRKDVCMVATSPGTPVIGTVCATVAQALRHGIANTSLDRATGRRTIVGVVPDGTRSVVVKSRGSSEPVPVRDDQFVLRDRVDEPPNLVVLR